MIGKNAVAWVKDRFGLNYQQTEETGPTDLSDEARALLKEFGLLDEESADSTEDAQAERPLAE